MKDLLPADHCAILSSFLADRTFDVAVRDSRSSMEHIHVLGPFLHILYTADMPTPVNNTNEASTTQLLLAIYADDTAMLASHSYLQFASNGVQEWLHAVEPNRLPRSSL